MWPASHELPTADLDHSILHNIDKTAKKSILDPLYVADINLAIFAGLSKNLVCNCTKGGVTTLQHHSSKNKSVPHHRTFTEYIILTNHVAHMYSYTACLL